MGLLSITGSDFRTLALTPYSSLPIADADRIIAMGKFDRSGRRRLLYDNNPPPVRPLPAVLTCHSDNARTGLNPNESRLTLRTSGSSACARNLTQI